MLVDLDVRSFPWFSPKLTEVSELEYFSGLESLRKIPAEGNPPISPGLICGLIPTTKPVFHISRSNVRNVLKICTQAVETVNFMILLSNLGIFIEKLIR